MGAKHTPGPWDYVPANEHHGPYVTTDYGTTVADLYVLSEPVAWSSEARKPIPFMGEMAEANARLIASAPDLLEALKAARETILYLKNARWSECEGSDDEWIGYIDAAIARATGEAA
jgi:hypothetical protein